MEITDISYFCPVLFSTKWLSCTVSVFWRLWRHMVTCFVLFELDFVALIVEENLEEISFYLIRVVILHVVCRFFHVFVASSVVVCVSKKDLIIWSLAKSKQSFFKNFYDAILTVFKTWILSTHISELTGLQFLKSFYFLNRSQNRWLKTGWSRCVCFLRDYKGMTFFYIERNIYIINTKTTVTWHHY